MLHGQFVQQTKEVGNQDRWQQLPNEILKRETESLIFAAQEQAIRTIIIKAKIDKSKEGTTCRIRSRTDKTINHIVVNVPHLLRKTIKKA